VFPALALGTLMATLDISVVNIALPTLSRAFGVPLTTIEWVVLAYVVTITALLLAFGRLSDLRGRRRVYGTGLLAFIAASALCASAPGAGWLIAARALQGVGAAMMMSNSAALLVSSFGPEERGRALGAFGAMVGVGLALGPPLGGILVGYLSWRWIFLVNLPIGVLTFWLVRRRIPADPPPHAGPAVDGAGAALWLAGLTALMLALSQGPARGWGSPSIVPLFAAAAVALAAFIVRESRRTDPLLPVAWLRGPFGVAASLTLLGQASSVAVGFHLPLYLEDVLGLRAVEAGRWLAVLPLVALLVAPFAGRWADRAGSRPLTAGGLLLAAAGYAILSGVGVAPSPLRLFGGMALIGGGLGLFTVPNTSALMSAVPSERLGIASGLQATMRNLGVAAGTAATAAIVASRYAVNGGGALAASAEGAALDRGAFATATRDLYAAMAAIATIAAAIAWLGTPGSRGAGRVADPVMDG
jgi:EmrB/QacA subfamily drug resistance transporter